MPDQEDNVTMEKISISGSDFSDSLNNSFGIEDTQVLASNDLTSFLLSDPDKVKPAAEDKPAPDAKEVEDTKPPADKTKPDPTKKDKPDGETSLKNILFDSEEEGGEDTTHNSHPEKVENAGEDVTYQTLGKDLLRLGVFSKNSDDETEETINIKTPEEFLERFTLEKKKGAINILENFLGQFGEDRRQLFDAIFTNGVDPQAYLQSFAKAEQIAGLDMAVEANQERVLKAHYKSLKWDDQKIESRIQKLKDYGDLEDEAKTFHEVLLNKEKETLANIEKTKVEETAKVKAKETETLKSFQRILTEKLKTQEIDGIPLTQKDAEDVIKYMVNKPYKLESGELLSEMDKDILELNRPENHELKIKLGLLLKKKLDLSSIKKTAISKKSDALFTLATKNAKQESGKKEMKSFF